METRKIDAVRDICPIPLLRVQEEAATLRSGGTIIVDTAEPQAVRNILEWARQNSFGTDVVRDERGIWQLTLMKR